MCITFNPNEPNHPELIGSSMSDWAYASGIDHPETQEPIVEPHEMVTSWSLNSLVNAGCHSITVYRRTVQYKR